MLAGQTYPEVLFILDGSGSMWGKVGAEVKIDAAKSVMAEVVPALDENVKWGYSHTGIDEKETVRILKFLTPPGSTDRAGMLAKVKDIAPRGKTPISDAVVAAAELLKTKEVETTIILVSDEIETCAADPCAIVRNVKATGIKFVMARGWIRCGCESEGATAVSC